MKVRAPENTELTLGGQPMELTATGRESGMEITQFSQPVTITVEYTDEDAARQLEHAGMKDESSLTLFYYNETEGTWYPLPTSVDSAANRLTAITEHFSLFDYQAQNWEAARLPSLEGFQLSAFTGAGSYSFPIQVPPGPGGFSTFFGAILQHPGSGFFVFTHTGFLGGDGLVDGYGIHPEEHEWHAELPGR